MRNEAGAILPTQGSNAELSMVKQISCVELERMLTANEPVYLLDVRRQWEHDRVHLPNSVLIPLDELSERAEEIDAPEGATLVAYCHHGVRSLSAAVILTAAGHLSVVSLRGGIDAWSREIDGTIPRYS